MEMNWEQIHTVCESERDWIEIWGRNVKLENKMWGPADRWIKKIRFEIFDIPFQKLAIKL